MAPSLRLLRNPLSGDKWLARKHGTHRRRQYRKVHLAMNTGSGDILAAEFT